MNIYFVCTGNTCRSPMAEAILRAKKWPDVAVKSAGIYAVNGGAMSANAQAVLDAANIEHQHVSKPVTKEDLEWADVILTMTHAHKQAILQNFGDVQYKLFTLKEYTTVTDGDVSDPYGGTVQTYQKTFEQLQQLIGQISLEGGAYEKRI